MDVSNADIAAAFRQCRHLMANGFGDGFICHTLPDTAAGCAARKVVQERLGAGNYTYGDWLYQNHPEVHDSRYIGNDRAGRKARLYWLDQLIEEFSK